MSSEEGGVGTTSSRIRRSRARRAGVERSGAIVLARGLGAARLARRAFDGVLWAFAGFLGFALLFGFEARRFVLGRLAERTIFLRVLAFLPAGFRPALLGLAMTDAPSEP